MGFSVSGSYLIVGLAVLVALAGLYGAVSNGAERTAEALDDRGARAADRAGTAFAVGSVRYDGSTLSVEVENTGSTTLAVSRTDAFVDGRYFAVETLNYTVDGDPDTDLLGPGETLALSLDVAAPDRLKLVTGTGVAVTVPVPRFAETGAVAFTRSDALASVADGTVATTGYAATGTVVGPVVTDFARTDVAELPAVDADGDLFVATVAGERVALAGDARTSPSRLAVGRFRGSPAAVFYAESGSGDLARVGADGTAATVATATADGVGGVADLDGDGSDELVYGGNGPGGNSDSVAYVDDDGTLVGTGAGYGTNAGIGLGEPADFDGDGAARVPIVDGSNDVTLVAADGTTTVLTTGGPAAKAPLATADLDADGAVEVAFRTTSGTLSYVDDVGGTNAVRPLENASGGTVAAGAGTGTA